MWVQILCVIPVPILRWTLVGLAFLLSGYFLVVNVYPILASVRLSSISLTTLSSSLKHMQADAKAVRLIIILLVLFHAAVALCYKVLFFSYYITNEIGPKDPIGGSEGTEGAEVVKRWLMSMMS